MGQRPRGPLTQPKRAAEAARAPSGALRGLTRRRCLTRASLASGGSSATGHPQRALEGTLGAAQGQSSGRVAAAPCRRRTRHHHQRQPGV